MNGNLPVSLGGRPYLLGLPNYTRGQQIALRSSIDSGAEAGDNSLATNQVWRRQQTDWSNGAGERYFDPTAESDRKSFHYSVGLDPWTKGRLSLLPSTTLHSANVSTTDTHLTQAGRYVAYASGTPNYVNVYDPATAVTTGYPMGAIVQGIAADGEVLYVATASGIKKFVIAGPTTTDLVTSSGHDFVAVCNGRLLAGNGSNLYEYSAAGAVLTTFTLTTIPTTTGWTWRSATGAPGFIFVAGGGGSASTFNTFGGIYRIEFDPSTGGLRVPLYPATDLPRLERPNKLLYCTGDILAIGTSAGLRLATINTNGNVAYGPPVGANDTGNVQPVNVKALAQAGKFLYFGWADLLGATGGKTGIGRADLSNFWRGPLSPAYAPDVMADTNGAGIDGIAFTNASGDYARTWFGLAGVGAYKTTSTLVADGYFFTGEIHFGFLGDKIAFDLDMRHDALPGDGSIRAVQFPVDQATSITLGTSAVSGSFRPVAPLSGQDEQSDGFYLKFHVLKSSTGSVSPSLRRWILRALPVASGFEQITIPLIFAAELDVDGWKSGFFDTLTEYQALLAMQHARTPVVYVEGGGSYTVTVDAVELKDVKSWNKRRSSKYFFDATVLVQMTVFSAVFS